MNVTIGAMMMPDWTVTDAGVRFKDVMYSWEKINSVKLMTVPTTPLTNGVVQMQVEGGALLTLAFSFKQKKEALEAVEFIKANYGDAETKTRNEAKREKEGIGLIYDLKGVRGRSMRVYEDRVVIKVEAGLGAFITGNASDGEKTIYYRDCIGVQFKESGLQIGYLQIETASGLMNARQSNFFNENSFTFDTTVQSNEKMNEVADYVRERVSAIKNAGSVQQVVQNSPADELKKYKELLDMGILTQEEFDTKKKQLLGL